MDEEAQLHGDDVRDAADPAQATCSLMQYNIVAVRLYLPVVHIYHVYTCEVRNILGRTCSFSQCMLVVDDG